jgi:hypothetical protein
MFNVYANLFKRRFQGGKKKVTKRVGSQEWGGRGWERRLEIELKRDLRICRR